MTSPAPRVTIARPSRSNGVLSIPASATQRRNVPAHEAQPSRLAATKLKIIIRRLPPGLTQVEFEEALGDDWKTGGDKVDWAIYKDGKVSKDPAKPSRPSRAYLHLTKQDHIALLSEKVQNTIFNDAGGSSKDSALLGPPSVEFAPYGRVPNSRPRKDARQGTIDQDPEFIDFLESLTNPIAKSAPVDQENESTAKSKEKVTVTPLIQFLRDKKANKGKESAAPTKGPKHSRQDSKDSKSGNVTGNKSATGTSTISSPKRRSAQAVKVEQAARDAVRVLNKQAATSNKGPASPNQSAAALIAKSQPVTPNSTANAALADKKRERGNASAAAKILQRDLGLGGNAVGRGGKRGMPGSVARSVVANATSAAKPDTVVAQATSPSGTATVSSPTASATNTIISGPSAASGPAKPSAAQPPLGPAASRPTAKASAPNSASTASATAPSAKPALPPSTATQAFLKHANPSQGITEPLLEEAFAVFGTISKVEIDKKKGFAYVNFAEPENLQKAIKASPIKVAQGQVVVLERKTGSNLQARNVRGGGAMMKRGGGMPIGGRGAPVRGRGGYGRGGANMPNKRPLPPAATTTPAHAPAAAPASTGAIPTTESSAQSPPNSAPTSSSPLAPTD